MDPTAAHQENRDLATRVKTLEFPSHQYDDEHFDAPHHKLPCERRDGGMHNKHDRSNRDHDRERDRYPKSNESPRNHEERLFKFIKLYALTFDGSLDP